ncbi:MULTISPECIES: FIST signal transduction protein [Xanthobacter]|uniref:FIST signal transduction protein n=1 Tax=Xanthobacter TaxID=279 RepID=UPI0024A70E41|nr:FIST N-terminal domain-containing protein [Xanthobacter autotrophicus]MDI4657373.1 FIST C-terminal domain-containing protein [Xanthobacter autotrophicus]MDI4665531.1 FIST C-terminal domain-containing protein [Xanthobacter autotrophicus]
MVMLTHLRAEKCGASVPVVWDGGVVAAWSNRANGRDAIAEIAGAARVHDVGFLLIFASSYYDPRDIVDGLAAHFPDVPHAGCSTAGEIGPTGIADRSLVALAFPKDDFDIACSYFETTDDFSVELVAELVAELCHRLDLDRTAEAGHGFALTLLDGLGRHEELVLAALQGALDDIPMVGGSLGDDLAFTSTFAFCDGRTFRGANLVLLIRTDRPFELFKSDHFLPTSSKLVVTACDPDLRVVTELNAESAWLAFAEAAHVDPDVRIGINFAAHPLLVRVGGEYYCRSIQKLNDDNSLSFYCAIDTGVILTVAKTKDMVATLEETLSSLENRLGGLDFVLGFDCIHRRLEAENRQIVHQISDIFRRFRVFGFSTYGEQYNAMHLNHTFSGVAFGRRQ